MTNTPPSFPTSRCWSRTSRLLCISLAIALLAGCAAPPTDQLRAEVEPMQFTTAKQAVEVIDCVVPAWEGLLINNFVYVRPTGGGYRIDKTSDLGHLYASLDLKPNTDQIAVSLWIIKRYLWSKTQRKEMADAVRECL